MAAALDASITVFPLSVEKYHAMIENDILTEDDRVELLEGVLVEKVSKNPPHRISSWATRKALERLVPAGWYVDEQSPITLARSEPEPDIAVIRGDNRDYPTRHPGAAEVGLVIEVADTSLQRDRGMKKRIYATAGIPYYWIINLIQQRLEVYSEPAGEDYAQCSIYAPDQAITVVLEGSEVGTVQVRDLLP